MCSSGTQGRDVSEPCVQPPSLERQLLSSAPPGHLAASKVWLGSISKLHRQQLRGPCCQGSTGPRGSRWRSLRPACHPGCTALGAGRAGQAQRPLCRGPCLLSSWVCRLEEQGPNTFSPVTTQQHRAEGGCCSPCLNSAVLGGRVWECRWGAGMDSPAFSH